MGFPDLILRRCEFSVIASEAKQSRCGKAKTGLLRRGVYHRAGQRPDPLAPRNDAKIHFRLKTSLASIVCVDASPAACSAIAAGSPDLLHHGNFVSIPRVTGSPSTPPKSSGQKPFGTASTVT